MACGCNSINSGKETVDLVRSKGRDQFPLRTPHEIVCENCNEVFTMKTHVDKCSHCGMTYGVTPCSSSNKDNVKPAGINY